MAVDQRDYYQVLGVPRGTSAEEIQRAYRTLARRHHPDVNKEPGAEDRFKEITEAYHVLSNPDSRRRYDRFGPQWRQVPEGHEEAAGWGGRGGRVRVGQPGDVDLEDLLGSLFGDRFGAGCPEHRRRLGRS